MKFIVIGITDNPNPYFPPEVMAIIRDGKVFSGGKRHHEIVAPLLPADAEWIDITVPLDAVFDKYSQHASLHSTFGRSQSENTRNSTEIIVFASGDPLFFGLRIRFVGRFQMLKSSSILPSTRCSCWPTDW